MSDGILSTDPEVGNEQKFCFRCGTLIRADAAVCPHCGARQERVSGRRNRVIAAILAFLFGSFGAHRFYLGQIGMGLLYLVFFWTVIPGIIAIVEGIIYLTMSDERFAERYG
ncbi:TM2 domain-containing protein [Acuticoccus mangrovi]|uniref:NINE protein n=1 Tax=Acuticoccus mangrovi TaxID=2796142 RepID=A0A934MHM8_9HYPH|nr:TM2 domain-containing protein [Acuticoccus mangrovi]MBJ3777838.1 NINE protein [Acuticoccus mangrovi]